jgi:hypothetical protein
MTQPCLVSAGATVNIMAFMEADVTGSKKPDICVTFDF